MQSYCLTCSRLLTTEICHFWIPSVGGIKLYICRATPRTHWRGTRWGLLNQVPEETSPHLFLGHKTNDLARNKINSLVGPQEPLLTTVKKRKLAWCGMSHATTACPKQYFRAPWRVGDAMVSGGNAGWTTSKSGHPCSRRNCSKWPPAEKAGRGSVLNRPSRLPYDPIGQGTELNWRWQIDIYHAKVCHITTLVASCFFNVFFSSFSCFKV